MERSAALVAILAAAAFAASPAAAADTPPAAPSPKPRGTYQICVMPFGCGARGVRAPAPRPETPPKEEGKPARLNLTTGADPLSQAILQETVQGGGVTSAVRLSPEFTGAAQEQILYRTPGSLDLPAAAAPAPKRSPTSAPGEQEVASLGIEGGASESVEGMKRYERGMKKSGAADSRDGSQKVWDTEGSRDAS